MTPPLSPPVFHTGGVSLFNANPGIPKLRTTNLPKPLQETYHPKKYHPGPSRANPTIR